MWRPYNLMGAGQGAGQGCNCASCRGGLAGAARRYPTIEATLRAYVANKAASGQYFHISPELNSATVRPSTMGGLGASLLDVTSSDPSSAGFDFSTLDTPAASGVAFTPAGDGTDPYGAIPSVSSVIGDFFGSLWGGGNTAPPQTVQSLPSDLRAPVAAAAKTDLFGGSMTPLIVGGGLILLLVAVLSETSKGRGRRR
jgi:hypothetical protein